MDVEKDMVGKCSNPLNEMPNLTESERVGKDNRKLRQSYFKRMPSNINEVSGSKGSSGGFPGSSSEESAKEEFVGSKSKPVYVTSVDFDETNIN